MNFLDEQVKVNPGFLDDSIIYDDPYLRSTNLDDVAILNDNETIEEAKVRIKNQASDSFKMSANSIVNNKTETGAAVSTIGDEEEKLFGLYKADDLYIEDDQLSKSPQYKALESRFIRNSQILSEAMEEAAGEQEGRSWVGYGIDFVDRELIRATLFGWVEGLTNRTSRQGSTLLNNLTTISDPALMNKFAAEYVNDIREEGVLKGDNYFAYSQMLREVYGLGYNPDEGMDKLFAGLDILGFTTLGKAAIKAVTSTSRAGLVGGVDAANTTALKLNKTIDPINDAAMKSSAVDLNGGKGVVRPSVSYSQNIHMNSQIVKNIMKASDEGAIPSAKRVADLDAAKAAAVTTFQKSMKANVYDTVIYKTPDGKGISFLVGTNKTGTPFKPKADGTAPSGAQKVADRIDGEVVPVNPADLSQGYLVKLDELLDVEKGVELGVDASLVTNAWNKTLGRILDNKWVGSAAARDSQELNELSLRSQAASKFINLEGKKLDKTINGLNLKDSTLLSTVVKDLGDGVNGVGRQTWSDTDFASRWRQLNNDIPPSPKVMEAFKASQELSDAAYYLKASEMVKTFVRKGYKNSIEVEDGVMLPAKKVLLGSLENDAKIYNKLDNSKLYKKDYGDLPRNQSLWKLNTPWNGQEYVVFPQTTKVISYGDVLGYSAYGRRTNPYIRYFLFFKKQDDSLKTVLGSVSAKQMSKATEQITAIQKAYAKNVTDDVLDDLISKNNDWNPNINTRADMDEWLNENNIDILDVKPDGISSRLRDAPVSDPNNNVFNGESASDYVNYSLARSDNVLTEYGGAKAYNPDPIDSIVTQYGTAAQQYATSFYTFKSMQGWIKQADEMMSQNMNVTVRYPSGIDPSDYKKRFLGAVVEGSSPEASRMRELQDIVKRRLVISSDLQNNLRQLTDEMSEEFYNATGKKISIEGAEGALLKTGFFSAFAFNLSQAFLQSSQIINVVAITGRKIGFKATVGSGHLRKILYGSDDIATENLGLSRFAKAMEMTGEQAKETAQLFREINPNIIMGDSIELGTGLLGGRSTGKAFGKTGFAASKVGKAIWNTGLKPFNFGEANAKSTAYMASVMEFQARFPKQSILSETGRNYVARRMETLTQNMSTTSRSKIQSGLGKVPTQWLSYFFRTMEQVFVGRDLTKLERAKLGAVVMPLYGFTGLGVGHTAETVAEWLGLNPQDDTDKAFYITLKYGVLDGFLTHFTPFDVALSTRMAPVTSVHELYRKFSEESVLSAVGGPSGNIAYTGLEALFNLTSNLTNGYTSTLTEDSLRVLRNLSGVNAVAKAVGIAYDDAYRSRKGIKLPVEVDISDAIISLTGFTPLQVTDFYQQQQRYFRLNKDFNKIRKQVTDRSKIAWEIYPKDPQRAGDILREATTIISKSALSYTKKQSLLRSTLPRQNDMSYLYRQLYDMDKRNALGWAASIQRN